MSLLLGIDVGGTTSTVAVGDQNGTVLKVSDQFPTRSQEGPLATIDDIVEQIDTEMEQLGHPIEELSQITLATPGPATCDGVLLKTPNLKSRQWDRFPMRQRLEEALAKKHHPIPIKYIGDGQAAALGEYSILKGKITWPEAQGGVSSKSLPAASGHLESLFMIAVGTGLGGGEVRDGVAVQGGQGRAGHAGHMMLPPDAFRYEHDQKLLVGNAYTTAESAISLTALAHQLEHRLKLPEWSEHPLKQVQGTSKDRAKRLRCLAADQDRLAIELFEDQARALGILVLMLQYIGDYDRIVIGGGICDMVDEMRTRYLALVKDAYQNRALDGFRDFDAISLSVCGDNASVLGAYAHAQQS